MNVSVENLAACKKLVRVDVAADAVDKALKEMTQEFQRHAKLPGFRPGKAPKHLVLKAYSSRIEEEVKRKLVSESYRNALKENNIHVVGEPDFEEIQFGKGLPFQFAITVETAPDFELPEYKGLKVKREIREVTEDDVDKALEVLQDQRSTYIDVDRPVGAGDFVVVNYKGSCEGKPITELAADATSLAEKKNFWLHVESDQFIPGFTDQLIEAKGGESRSVTVDFPGDFAIAELAGKKGVFEVEVLQVKERERPELNDELAKSYGAEDMTNLRLGVRNDLEAELATKLKRSIREQLMNALMSQVQCELPESIVSNETRSVVYNLVRENQQRGVSKETIDQQREQIYSYANKSAKDRIRSAFILGKIAAKEGIDASDNEVNQRIVELAQMYNIKPEQMARQLKERDGISEIQEQIVTSKVLEFLQKHAEIEEVLPTSQ